MNKNLLLAAVSLVALGATAPALAADLAARPYTKAPAMVAAIYDWSGFYIGINGGGGSSHAKWDIVGFGRDGSHDATGGTVGGQIGYRWQSGQFVFGLEGQGNWADFSGSHVGALSGNTNSTKIDSFGLITGQVGYAWNNVLLYVKGGAAVVGTKYDTSFGGVSLASANDTRWGGTVGAGLEFGFAPNWSIGAEYNHIFLGGNDRNLTGPAGVLAVNVKQDVDMGLVRLNYKFGGPMLGRY
ncbi:MULTISPECIES: outer membrane protein [Bradyrhizobium]|uniref:Outer membrane beta-barrel protein n=1 Tax=Bradyrhizobium symbiodeficiens TaxID=1404367 RepID=A0A2U8QCB1_9BRAD|nr:MULTISPECIES: outer membrane beta-barrel protein [Bradyrhizobium]AWM07814.1 porin family protein [Bradyrhizobium symbiodeficiens]QDF38308.1 porin family protein [Bradyrhizobium symbiodeficiens]QIP00800.1 porin family protein [Bradyrhizobium symbiodeficiens]QIP09585.1 porin family protein [Bradyrhizobium symbiodeficiens]UPJ54977.1 porin family protein [Bradyrhizobium sp. 192]